MDVRTNIIEVSSKEIDTMPMDKVIALLPPIDYLAYTEEQLRQWAFDILVDTRLRDFDAFVRDSEQPENNEHMEYK